MWNFEEQIMIKSAEFQPFTIEDIDIDDYLADIKKTKCEDQKKLYQQEIFEDLNKLNQSFIVKSYKLVIRDVVAIDDVKATVQAQSYKNTHNKFLESKKENSNSTFKDFFCPIYFMGLEYDDERFVFYYGKTNSSSPRFKNHKKLNQFKDRKDVEQKNKKLFLTQVFVTFCYKNKTYKDIPLEWLNFEVDNNKAQRKKLLMELKKRENDKRISLHQEIDKIILFIENHLIYHNTPGNDSIQMLRSLYQIYTPDIRIYFQDGKEFIANKSPKSHDDETLPTEIVYIGGISDYSNINRDISNVVKNGAECDSKLETLLSSTNVIEEYGCHDCTSSQYKFSHWKIPSEHTTTEEEFELWWDNDDEI
ncbi:hypothetical protein OF830_24010 [Bacillus paramycoides]|uniref:hypothetical protein n=1 Tax=Bacillus paramycoides TaxID=2026194 RepID=UPI0022430536|nr:hypothetical protein [Bacillus paramycoides]MCW9133901.1 hypothetical protein [Bacillus paramycoides]